MKYFSKNKYFKNNNYRKEFSFINMSFPFTFKYYYDSSSYLTPEKIMTLEENFNNSKNIIISSNLTNTFYMNLNEKIDNASKNEINFYLNQLLVIFSKFFKENSVSINKIKRALDLNINLNIGSKALFQILFRKILKGGFYIRPYERKLGENKNKMEKKTLLYYFQFQ